MVPFAAKSQDLENTNPFLKTNFNRGSRSWFIARLRITSLKIGKLIQRQLCNRDSRASYQIHNEDGQQVQAGDFPTIEDTAPQRRRDFYLYFKIDLNQLEPGNYRLRMEIEDLNAQKKGNLEQDLLFIVQ